MPIAFFGTGFTGRDPADGTGLDQIAPTLAAAMGYDRSHDEVRAGVPADGVADAGARTLSWWSRWSGKAWAPPTSKRTLTRGRSCERRSPTGGGTLEGTTGSLPLDPTATLTTIGTGGLPAQHGITGHDHPGRRRRRGTGLGRRRAAGSVIATLADDLDRDTDQRALIAGVLSSRSDRGIIGDGWYVDRRDRDTVVVTSPPGARGGGPPRPGADPREA